MTFCPKFEFPIIAQKSDIKWHFKFNARIIKIDSLYTRKSVTA